MKGFFLFFLLFLTNTIFISAQFAKLIDKDGFVNLRKNSSIKTSIIAKISSGKIVYIKNKDNDSDNWNYVEFYNEKGDFSGGFIHNSRLKLIENFEAIPGISSENSIQTFGLKRIEIKIETAKFNKENEKYLSVKNARHFYKGKEFYTPVPPKTYYEFISGKVNNQTFDVPKNELEALFDINPENTFCYLDEAENTIYIISQNSDGSDTYDVLFVITNGKYIKKQVFGLD